MPMTPLHGLSIAFLYFKDKNRVDLLALTVSATFLDLEPLCYLMLGEPFDHRIWHSFAVALTIYTVLVTFGVYMLEHFFERRLWSVYNVLRLEPNQVRYQLLSIYCCSLVGGVSHVFFDMFTHRNMPYVIYPLANGNPFYIGPASIVVEVTVVLLTVYSFWQWSMNTKKSFQTNYAPPLEKSIQLYQLVALKPKYKRGTCRLTQNVFEKS